MYAIIQTGGKQYRVSAGDVIDIELLEAAQGANVEFPALFLGAEKEIRVGTPQVDGVVVKAEVVSEVKGPKVVAFKYKRRKQYRRKVGHRQCYSRVKILEIYGT